MEEFYEYPKWEPRVATTAATPKPPLGVMPKKLWLEGRVKDLCDAIGRAADHGTLDRPHVVDWLNELRDRIAEVRQR